MDHFITQILFPNIPKVNFHKQLHLFLDVQKRQDLAMCLEKLPEHDDHIKVQNRRSDRYQSQLLIKVIWCS